MSGARVVVLGCGNPGRGDDALGPLLLERVARWAEVHPQADLRVVGEYQLQIEHALDLDGRDRVMFVNATVTGGEPYALAEGAPGATPARYGATSSPRRGPRCSWEPCAV